MFIAWIFSSALVPDSRSNEISCERISSTFSTGRLLYYKSCYVGIHSGIHSNFVTLSTKRAEDVEELIINDNPSINFLPYKVYRSRVYALI